MSGRHSVRKAGIQATQDIPDWRDGVSGLPPAAVPAALPEDLAFPPRGSWVPPLPPSRPPGEDSTSTVRIPRVLLAARLPLGPDPTPATISVPLPPAEPEPAPAPEPTAEVRPARWMALTKPVGPPEALRPPSGRRMAIGFAVVVVVVALLLFAAACAPFVMSSGVTPGAPAATTGTTTAPAGGDPR